MKTKIFFILLFILQGGKVFTQNLSELLINVDTLFIPGGVPGNLSPINQNVTPLVSSSPCNVPRYNYSLATQYQNGKVIALAHEAILSNNSILSYDNLTFLTNAIDWLNSGSKRISLKQGWINNNNISTLKNTLIADNYSFNTLSGNITSASLANTDVLILGNDWNDTQPYLADELTALDNFVANGGSILIAGLGWSWPKSLDLYPMNEVANLFGFEFTTDTINDSITNINGAPKLYNFYPENLDTTQTPYCPSPFLGTNFKRGDNLRVLRLAVSTTGEFTAQSGGTVATAALLDEWLDEINIIYGREYCVRFEIIANNNQLIFPDATTDPWGTLPAGSGGCTNADIILSQQASIIDNIIGSANYDISHVIAGSPFGGGCAGSIKRGVSGGLDIPVTRHELGHQFTQSHTINHTDNRNYEPENGRWTIQGGNAQGHAHAVSFHQLANFLLNDIFSTGNKIPTGNNIPDVDAGDDFVIPINTPFTLTGIASDSDANDNLTYVWDNMNRGIAQTTPVADDSQGAIFQRLLPNKSSSRTFPKISDVVANNNFNNQEQLPSQSRIMDIRLTVNDNHQISYNNQMINASGINSDDIQVTVADAGPFEVTSQNTNGITYTGGSSQMVTWDVNGTDTFPINTQNVSIRMSTDGGFTYPIELLESTANSGFSMVTLPNISSTNTRIKVSALNSIYFDINTHNFEIQSSLSTSEQDVDNSSILIYPNPTKDFFKIEVSNLLNYKVEIFSIQGQLISSQLNRDLFDVSNLSNGIYLLLITDLIDLNNKKTQKLLICR